MIQKLETIDELKDRWRVKRSWIYQKTRETGEGAIPRIKVGKYLRFIPEEVDEWLLRQNKRAQ